MPATDTLVRSHRPPPAMELRPPPTVALIESNAQIREAHRTLLEGWGLRVLEPDLGSAIPVRDELAGVLAVIADFELAELPDRGIPFTGLDIALLIARRAARAVPTLIISGNFGRQAIPACSPHHFPVLFRPVPPDLLRGWLAMVAVLPDGPRWQLGRFLHA